MYIYIYKYNEYNSNELIIINGCFQIQIEMVVVYFLFYYYLWLLMSLISILSSIISLLTNASIILVIPIPPPNLGKKSYDKNSSSSLATLSFPN